MYLLDNKRINIDTQITIDGTTYPNLRDPLVRAKLGVTEVPDPVYPEPADEFFVTENDNGTLNITPKSPSQILEVRKGKFIAAVQAHLDAKAQEKGYDNIVSACSYAGAVNPFQAESQAFVAWRGAVWAYCYGELAQVAAGTRACPALDVFIAELPGLV